MTSFANTKYPEALENSTLRHTGIGLLDMDKRYPRGKHNSPNEYHPNPCDARFATTNEQIMPAIASKYKRKDRSTVFKT